MGDLRRTVAGALVMAIAGLALAGGAAQAAKFKVLHSFCEGHHRVCGDGSNPRGALVMDAAGNFFGTTSTGGEGYGTVFELERKDGGSLKFKTLYRFCSQATCGGNPSGALVIDTSGKLYGTATNLVFELSPGGKKGQWTEKVIYGFCSQQNCTDGENAVGGLTYAGASSGVPYDGVSPLYGVTVEGGANNAGTVFELTNNGGTWAESVLYSFCSQGGSKCTDGTLPISGLLADTSGNLFGTTLQGGGQRQAGVAFELSAVGGNWTYTLLDTFCSQTDCTDGAEPDGALSFDATGALVGTTGSGGASCKQPKTLGCGTVFRLVPNGTDSQLTVLHSFCQLRDCKDGWGPEGGVAVDGTGALYGTTGTGGGQDTSDAPLGGGIAFVLSDTDFRVLHRFCSSPNCVDGERPTSGVIFDSEGELLGTAEKGGLFNEGAVFKINPAK